MKTKCGNTLLSLFSVRLRWQCLNKVERRIFLYVRQSLCFQKLFVVMFSMYQCRWDHI